MVYSDTCACTLMTFVTLLGYMRVLITENGQSESYLSVLPWFYSIFQERDLCLSFSLCPVMFSQLIMFPVYIIFSSSSLKDHVSYIITLRPSKNQSHYNLSFETTEPI